MGRDGTVDGPIWQWKVVGQNATVANALHDIHNTSWNWPLIRFKVDEVRGGPSKKLEAPDYRSGGFVCIPCVYRTSTCASCS